MAALALTARVAAGSVLGGVAESCMDFGAGQLPGVYNKDYTSPLNSSALYFAGKSFSVIRMPFLWERLQPSLTSPVEFDPFYVSLIDEYVANVTGLGMQIVLDPHNYARYRGNIIGQSGSPVSAANFAAFWAALATRFMANDKVVFGIMNEPNSMPTELWVEDANAAIAAIRGVGATNLLTVPGNAWTGACSWFENWYGTSNAEAFLNIKDPLHHFAVELHLYFDSDHSGTHPDCTSPTIGVECLSNVTNWLRENNLVGFVGEFAGGNNAGCEACVNNTLAHMAENADVWWGWSWWAAGPWWGSYMFSLEPGTPPNTDKPQMAWLAPFV